MSEVRFLQTEIPFGEKYGLSEAAVSAFIGHFQAAKVEMPDVKIPVFYGIDNDKFLRIMSGEENLQENLEHLWGGISDVVQKEGSADCEITIEFLDDHGQTILHALEEEHHALQLYPVVLEVPNDEIDFAALLIRIT